MLTNESDVLNNADAVANSAEDWLVQYSHPSYRSGLELIIPSIENVSAKTPDQVGHRKDVAILTAWTEVSGLSVPEELFDVMSTGYQSKLGAELVIWGLATRPWIRNLIVVGNNVGNTPSAANSIQYLANIRAVALESEDYEQVFLSLMDNAEKQNLLPKNFCSGFRKHVPLIMRDVITTDAFGTSRSEDIVNIVNELPVLQPVRNERMFLPIEMPGRFDPRPIESGHLMISRQDSGKIDNLWQEVLLTTLLYGASIGRYQTKQIQLGLTIPYEPIDGLRESVLVGLGNLTRESVSEYLRLVAPPYLTDQDEIHDVADYFYGERIFGKDFFPEAWEEIENAHPTSNIAKWLQSQRAGIPPVNQFEITVRKIAENISNRQAVIHIGDPRLDIEAKNPPCLQSIQFLSRDGEEILDMHLNIRSWDLFKAMPKNVLGMMFVFEKFVESVNVQRRAAGLSEIKPGVMTVNANSAHIYETDLVEVQSATQSFKGRPYENDPRGNFTISPEGGKVVVQFQAGESLIKTRAMGLRNYSDVTRIVNEVVRRELITNNPTHIAYLTQQLMALLNNEG